MLEQLKYIFNKYNYILGILVCSAAIFYILFKLGSITNFEITLIQFLAGVGTTLTIILLFKRDKKSEKQLQHTREQIDIQDSSRKDQQFLDAIKLIEENKYDKSHYLGETYNLRKELSGLKILEILAENHIEYRQRVLDYIGIQTERLRQYVKDMEIDSKNVILNSHGASFHIGFKEYKIELNGYEFDSNPSKVRVNQEVSDFKKSLKIEGLKLKFDLESSIIIKDKFGELEFYPESDSNIPLTASLRQVEVKLIDLNRETLRFNFLQYLNQHNLKFEKECLLLAEKIFHIHSKKPYILNISNIFLPFININRHPIETNLRLIAQNENNLIGLSYQKFSDKETTIFHEHILPDYSILQKCDNLNSSRELVKGIQIHEINSINIPKNIGNSYLNKLLIDYSSIRLGNPCGKTTFKTCTLRDTIFEGKNKSWEVPTEEEEVEMFPKLLFIDCEFGYNTRFKNFKVQEIYFKNCKLSKDLIGVGLNGLTILSNNKEKLFDMIKDLKELKREYPELKLPEFKHKKIIKKELKSLNLELQNKSL